MAVVDFYDTLLTGSRTPPWRTPLTYQVQFRRERQTYLDGFPAERVRLDTVDRSRGRS